MSLVHAHVRMGSQTKCEIWLNFRKTCQVRPIDVQKFIAQWATDSWNMIPKTAVKKFVETQAFLLFP